jgi:hypothetical protein
MGLPTRFGDLLRRVFVRYATVTARGILLPPARAPVPEVTATLIRATPARTFYRDRRPVCRSLDAVRSLKGRACAGCPDRAACTPQILVDIEVDGMPYRLLLAYTSARNFVLLVERLATAGRSLEKARLRITVLDRGHFGEVRFTTDPA